MSYVIVLIATTLGVLGVILTRRNQFNSLRSTSHVLIWLIVIAGVAGIVDIAYKDDAVRGAERRAQLREARLSGLALKPFDLSKPPAAARFVIEAGDADQPIGIANFSGPFPAFGRKGKLGRIDVDLPDVFSAHAELFIEADGGVRFTQTDAEGHAPHEGEAGPWFRPTPGQSFAYGSDLSPQKPLARILSALKANGQNRLGTMEVDVPNNPQTRTFVSVNLERIFPAFKFYVQQETQQEPCTAVVTVPMRFETDPPRSETRMRITLRMIERETLAVVCEKLPF